MLFIIFASISSPIFKLENRRCLGCDKFLNDSKIYPTIQYKNDLINILNKYISNLIHEGKANKINAKKFAELKATLSNTIASDLN